MRYFKTICMVMAADIFALFVGFTLAGSSSAAMKTVSGICGVGILAVILVNYSIVCARKDIKDKAAGAAGTAFLMGASASLPYLVSWGVLALSVRRHFQFYRAHKLINSYFLQILNLIEPDPSSKALSGGELLLMLPLALVPALIACISYLLVRKGLIFTEN